MLSHLYHTLNPVILVIVIIIYVSALVWLANDVHDRWGQEGCIVVGAFYLVFAPLFPVVVILYLLMRQYAYRNTGKSERTERVDQWTWRAQQQQQGGQAQAGLPYISAAESDESIDLLLAEGKREEALQAAQDMLEAARGFDDQKGVDRYTKYVGYIKRGGGKPA
jgi:hypothetical protein